MKIENKDTFCYLPFGSVAIEPDGTLKPCCIAKPFKESINSTNFDSIDDLVNSPPYKRIRKEMLQGTAPFECDECFVYKNQHREASNREYVKEINDVDLYNEDYSVNKIVYTDLRLSNTCNLKCRMCCHNLSSSWYEFWGYIQNNPDYLENNTKFIKAADDSIKKFSNQNINDIKKIYLAGGEPFITPSTYELLDRFSDEQASNVTVLVNTNLSTLEFKGENVLDKLKRFKYIEIACSCDGYGEIGEFQRPGFKTQRFFSNFKKLIDLAEKYNKFEISIDYTISTINMYHVFDFIKYVHNNYIHADNIRFHHVTEPIYFAPGNIKEKYLKELINLYEQEIKHFQYEPSGSVIHSLNEFVKYLKLSLEQKAQNLFKERSSHMTISIEETLQRFDKVHGTDYKKTCPWLSKILMDNTQID